jgi:hypothetical protein
VGDFNIPLSPIGHPPRFKKQQQRNHRIKQHYRSNGLNRYFQNILSNSYTIYILLHSLWNISKIDHMLGHKASHNKYKKIEIMDCVLLEHDGIKLEMNSK